MLTAPDYSLQQPERLETSGKVSPGYEVRIVDADGNDCGDGELGSLVVHGAALARGYSVTNNASDFLEDGGFNAQIADAVSVLGAVEVGRAAPGEE